jgi:sigma-B regulation protein RsbU (phosphoserine phosphatase)
VASALLSVTLSRVLSPSSDASAVLRPDTGGGDDGRAPAGRPMSPAEVTGRLNRMFPFDEATEQFFTILYGVLDVQTGEFRYVSAGHPGAAIIPADGGGRIVESSGFPIGLTELPYEEYALTMAPGDRIYLYSDGIPEAMDGEDRVFGGDRLLGALGRARGEPLERSVAGLLEDLERWAGPAGLRDDVSLVAVEFLGP